jgi:hypothetical protein
MSYWEKVKKHFKKNKNVYIVGIGVAGITTLIMKGSHAGLIDRTQRGLQDHRVHGFFLFNFKSPVSDSFNQTIVNCIEREGRGHPGYIVMCKETLEEFPSQVKAALNEGVSDMIMSLHIRGEIPDINGHHYKRVMAA